MKTEELISKLAEHMEARVCENDLIFDNGCFDWVNLAKEVVSLVQPNWISAEEKLPENYSFVLCSIKSPVSSWVEILGFGDGKFQLQGFPCPPNPNEVYVTHWMEKPQPVI